MLKPLLLSLFALALLSLSPSAQADDSGASDAASVSDESRDSGGFQTMDDLLEEVAFPKKKRKIACQGNEAFAAPHCQQYGHKIYTKGSCFGDDPNDRVGIPAPCCCGG